MMHFNWLPTQTAWQESESWRARRQAMVQDTLDASDLFNSAFATAATNQITGAATLAANAAVARIKAATKVKLAKTAALTLDPALTAKVDKTV